MTPLRGALPNVFGAGDENTDVSNHCTPDPIPPSTVGVPLTSGRCVLSGAFNVALDIVMPIGDPVWYWKMPLTCQPPRIWLATPSRSHFRSGPHGSCTRKLSASECNRS